MTKTEVDEKGPAFTLTSLFRVIEGLQALKKHTVRVQRMLDRIDTQKKIYPNGIFGALKEAEQDSRPMTRIEVFAEEQGRDSFGIIRELSVAYSSEKSLLELAQASNSVISVRALSEPNQRIRENRIIEDKLILKRKDGPTETPQYRSVVPSLFVSSRWIGRMNLELGDRIIVSNPLENYVVPPPDQSGKRKER